jgi:hypothetical protein
VKVNPFQVTLPDSRRLPLIRAMRHSRLNDSSYENRATGTVVVRFQGTEASICSVCLMLQGLR